MGIVNPSGGGQNFSGALVGLTADLTGQNITSLTAIPFNTTIYDLDSFWNISNPTRLTIPNNVNYVRLSGCLRLANVNTNQFAACFIGKNGSATNYQGGASQYTESYGTPGLSVTSPVLQVTSGDYFEFFGQVFSDTSVDITMNRTSFSIQVLG